MRSAHAFQKNAARRLPLYGIFAWPATDVFWNSGEFLSRYPVNYCIPKACPPFHRLISLRFPEAAPGGFAFVCHSFTLPRLPLNRSR
jgi:hypothetical protein